MDFKEEALTKFLEQDKIHRSLTTFLGDKQSSILTLSTFQN